MTPADLDLAHTIVTPDAAPPNLRVSILRFWSLSPDAFDHIISRNTCLNSVGFRSPFSISVTFCLIHTENCWYQAHADTDMLQQHIDKDEVRETLKRRLESIQPYIERNTQTQRGMIFEILADRTIATLSKLLTLLLSLARGQTLGVW